jgi:hypothetical protein
MGNSGIFIYRQVEMVPYFQACACISSASGHASKMARKDLTVDDMPHDRLADEN